MKSSRTVVALAWCLSLALMSCSDALAGEGSDHGMASPGNDLISGVDTHALDPAVRLQDDFYAYVNGPWAKATKIPASKSRWGTYDELRATAARQVRAILDEVVKHPGAPGSETHKIADLYTTFIDENTRNARGFTPLESEFARIAAVTQAQELAALMADMARLGVTSPFSMS